jgi:hypothetical protein
MKNLKILSNEVLHKTTQSLVAEERKLTTSILRHLDEIQSRRLHSEMGYASLFEYAVKALGYSEAAAGRRIAAMRLLAKVPEIEPVLEKGDVSLSTLCTVQHFFQRKEEPVTRQEKKELVFALRGKSRRECEKELAALDPKACAPLEKERIIGPTQTEIRFVADDDLMDKLKQIRELDARSLGQDASYLELFRRMANVILKQIDPTKKKIRSSSKTTPPAEREKLEPTDQSNEAPKTPPAELDKSRYAYQSNESSNPKLSRNERYISSALRQQVWLRDHGQCTYKSPDGKHCESRFALEIDHRTPLALGGQTELANLRLLCRSHNTQQAISLLGTHLMRSYVR